MMVSLVGALKEVGAMLKSSTIHFAEIFLIQKDSWVLGLITDTPNKLLNMLNENGITHIYNNTTAVLRVFTSSGVETSFWFCMCMKIIVKPKAISDFINFLMGRYADTIVTVSNAVAN